MAGRDPQERAKSSDREAAIDLVELAHREGRIGSADRTIRKNNIATAATLAELEMITQDLAARAPGSVAPEPAAAQVGAEPVAEAASQPAATPIVAGSGEPVGEAPPSVSQVEFGTASHDWVSRHVVVRRRGGGVAVLLTLIAALVGVAIAGSVFLTRIGLPDIDLDEFDPNPSVEAADDQYAMDQDGFRWVIGQYRQAFDSTLVWQVVFYDGYVIYYQPNDDGSDSRVGWIYRDGGFTEFGSAQVNPIGEASPIDLRRLDLAALVRNLDQARTTLNVPDATVSHVIVGHDAFAERPAVTIYVTNAIGQNGFLQTDLRGRLIREVAWAG